MRSQVLNISPLKLPYSFFTTFKSSESFNCSNFKLWSWRLLYSSKFSVTALAQTSFTDVHLHNAQYNGKNSTGDVFNQTGGPWLCIPYNPINWKSITQLRYKIYLKINIQNCSFTQIFVIIVMIYVLLVPSKILQRKVGSSKNYSNSSIRHTSGCMFEECEQHRT